MWFPPWLHERTGCIWAPECLEVLRVRGLPCATRHRHIPRLSSSNIETRPGHVLVTPSHLLSCHIRLVLIFLTCSSSPPLTAKICVTTFFPGWEFWAHHPIKLYIFDFQSLLIYLGQSKKKLCIRPKTLQIGWNYAFKKVCWRKNFDDNNDFDILYPLTHNYDPYLLSCPQRAQRLIGLRPSLP